MAFLNQRLDSFWQGAIDKLRYKDEVEMLEDMY